MLAKHTRRATAAIAAATLGALALLTATQPHVTDGHAHPFTFNAATGTLTGPLWATPVTLHFDVDYSTGREPFRSTFTASRPERFVADVTRCAPMTWRVTGPTGRIDGGTVTYCPVGGTSAP